MAGLAERQPSDAEGGGVHSHGRACQNLRAADVPDPPNQARLVPGAKALEPHKDDRGAERSRSGQMSLHICPVGQPFLAAAAFQAALSASQPPARKIAAAGESPWSSRTRFMPLD